MTDSIIQTFLDNSFIKTDDAEHILKLDKAAEDIQKMLSKKKTKIIAYTLVALDPTITDNEPIIGEVEAVIIKHWSTFRNSVAKTKDTPIVYIQAVILEALNKLAKDEVPAAIIWLTGNNILSYYKLAGQEKMLAHFLLEIGKRVEESGCSKWSIPDNVKIVPLPQIELTLPEIAEGQVNSINIQRHLKAGSIHTSWGDGGESQFTSAQNNVNWPKFFSERAGSGIATEINAALDTQIQSLTAIATTIQNELNSYFTKIKLSIDTVPSVKSQSSQSLAKRSELLWWKQALYSKRLDAGYRSLNQLVLSLAVAVDSAESVDPIYPKSVDFFIKETLHDVLGDKADSKAKVTELLGQLGKISEIEKQLLNELCHESEYRKSFGASMADLMKNSKSIEDFFKNTGLEKSAEISLSDLTVWLFHDLQAHKLANGK